MSDVYILDANFFINLAKVGDEDSIPALAGMLKAHGDKALSTALVMEEIKTVRAPRARVGMREQVESLFNVESISADRVKALSSQIGSNSPQDADVSLMVLGTELGNKGQKTYIVTDDFKMYTSGKKQGLPFETIPPAAFLMKAAELAPNSSQRRNFRRMYKQVRRLEVDYMMSRRDIYDIQPKLTWLMDNLNQTQKVRTEPTSRVARPGEMHDLTPVLRWLNGERVRKSKLGIFEKIIPFLEPLRQLPHSVTQDGGEFSEDELIESLAVMDRTIEIGMHQAQMGCLQLNQELTEALSSVVSYALCNLQFSAGVVHFTLGNAEAAGQRLGTAALLAAMGGNHVVLTEAAYLNCLLGFYDHKEKENLARWSHLVEVAKQVRDNDLKLRAYIGQAICHFYVDEEQKATRLMAKVNKLVEGNEDRAANQLEELGDHLEFMARPEIAIHVFDEAMECAVEAGELQHADRLLEKIKRCHFQMGDHIPDISRKLDRILDLANEIQSEDHQARYAVELDKLSHMREKLSEPLGVEIKDWTRGKKLPAVLRQQFELVGIHHVDDGPKGEGEATVIIGYHGDLGNLAFYLPSHYQPTREDQTYIQVKGAGEFRVFDAPESYREQFRARAIVGAKDPSHLDFELKVDLPATTRES